MDKTDIIQNLLSKPYWLIDVLPKQVPAGSAGQYFKAERYFLSWLDEISWKFAGAGASVRPGRRTFRLGP